MNCLVTWKTNKEVTLLEIRNLYENVHKLPDQILNESLAIGISFIGRYC